MKVFISWSGENSRKLAEALRNWLPSALQAVRPYFTPADVEKGTRWTNEIAKELESSEIGILCVTRDNVHSDWIMFEAGALSKSLEKSHVCPVLFGISNTDLAGPLRQFQTTEFKKDEMRKLLSTINVKLGDNKLPGKVLETVFEKWWPELEMDVERIIAEFDESPSEPVRSERDLLVEILELSRATAVGVRRTGFHLSARAIRELLASYFELYEETACGKGNYQDTLEILRKMAPPLANVVRQSLERSSSEPDELLTKLNSLTFSMVPQSSVPNDDDLPF